MNRLMTNVTSFLALSPALTAACLTGSVTCFVPRTPHGIYATVGINMYENNYLRTHSSVPSDYFTGTVYPELLANPDLSGITLYVFWSKVNPNPGAPSPADWKVIDDLFKTVETYNSTNKTHKTVQLVVTPGINSPEWLLGKVGQNDGVLKSCNYLFDKTYPLPPSGTECGKVTFSGFDEGGYNKNTMVASSQDQPMPWNSTYKNAWQTFLTALAAQYGSRPELVSIAVAGPTASSEEMILPANKNTYGGNGGPQLGGLTPEQMWNKLLAHHYTSAYKDYTKYLNSDVAIIDEWEHAIDMFGKTFSELTLTMSTGDGLPNLDAPLLTDTPCNLNKGTCSFTMATSFDFSSVCIVADMDCAAETTILAYFIQSTVGGPNAKATQTDGMKGGAKHGNLSVPSVKLISESTDLYTWPSQRILGGSQLNQPFSSNAKSAADEGGCPAPTVSTPWPCSPEQALYNVLAWFFDGTNQSLNFPPGTVSKNGGHPGSAPLNYLQIWGVDIKYASDNASNPTVPMITMGGSLNPMSAQDLLHKASLALAMIAEH
jgi:hypothetical protein